MKVLIIGLGSIGKKHVLAIKTVRPDVDIIALRSHQDAENFMDVKNIYALDEIEKPVPDFVIISNPTSEHKKTVSELIKFNIPLFIEKPIFSSLNIQKLIDNLNSTDIFTYVACNLRFLDCIRFIKEQKQNFNQKRLNEVNVYCGSYLPDWRLNIDFRKTYSAIPELGGGVHIDRRGVYLAGELLGRLIISGNNGLGMFGPVSVDVADRLIHAADNFNCHDE